VDCATPPLLIENHGGNARQKPQPKVLPLARKALPVASNTEAGAKRAKALELAGEGLSQARIARELGVSAATVSRLAREGLESRLNALIR
jgi:DNA-directed RNA polymerase specialized sigma24 family protein